MLRIVKAFRRPPAVRMPDRNGGFPRLSDGPMLVDGAHGFRCSTLASAKPPAEPGSPRHALLAENLGKPSLGVVIKDLWYKTRRCRRTPAIRPPSNRIHMTG